MEIKVNLALCVLVVLTCSSHTRGQNTTQLPHISGSALNGSDVATATFAPHSPNVTRGPTPGPTVASTENATIPIASNSTSLNSTATAPPPVVSTTNSSANGTDGVLLTSSPQPKPQDNSTLQNETTAAPPNTTAGTSSPAVNGSMVATQSPGGTVHTTTGSLNASSPSSASTTPHVNVALSSAPPSKASPTTASTQPATPRSQRTSSTSSATANPDTPSELNVGDEDVPSAPNSGTSLDPLLAGLVSVFIVGAAIVSLLIFLKFRQRNSGPEFRRLQDLPMDDMMEDTPLSMFTY
ncbi:hypothetical protein AGOR_G00149970 [Albula goreensis]|uniref:Uncharacterized protein n=1 Tax=Albula goreensis TaxID=1534307 RepID=A0A8T3DB07_9TELE|nr:hypothetical protein AGOR_G00149970 [Albula goreensis]